MIDVHVHMGALPAPGNGCRMSRRMLRSFVLRGISWGLGLDLDRPEEANRAYLKALDEEISRSKRVDSAVLLAMDGVYGADGRLDEGATEFMISNDCVFEACALYPRFAPGASINPMRRDALDELERVADEGAVLLKVLPNAQSFDPGEARWRPFYRAMAKRGVALLSHVGYEFTLIGRDQSVGDVARLRGALEEGVNVIAAHGCSSGLFLIEKNLEEMRSLASRFRNFYLDASALTLPNRVGALWRLRGIPEIQDRILFGTDYPLPCFSYPVLAGFSLPAWRKARETDNRFDKQVAVLEGLGFKMLETPQWLVKKPRGRISRG